MKMVWSLKSYGKNVRRKGGYARAIAFEMNMGYYEAKEQKINEFIAVGFNRRINKAKPNWLQPKIYDRFLKAISPQITNNGYSE